MTNKQTLDYLSGQHADIGKVCTETNLFSETQ